MERQHLTFDLHGTPCTATRDQALPHDAGAAFEVAIVDQISFLEEYVPA
jgi:hypothetical protein